MVKVSEIKKETKPWKFFLNSDQNKYPENHVEILNLTLFIISNKINDFPKHERNAAIGGSQSEDQVCLEINN